MTSVFVTLLEISTQAQETNLRRRKKERKKRLLKEQTYSLGKERTIEVGGKLFIFIALYDYRAANERRAS